MPTFETDADRLALLSETGDDVVYTPNDTGTPATIKAYIDLAVELQEIGTSTVTGSQPMGEARTSDLTGTLTDGLDTITFDGTTYLIKEPKDDGTGMTEFRMQEQ